MHCLSPFADCLQLAHKVWSVKYREHCMGLEYDLWQVMLDRDVFIAMMYVLTRTG